MLSTCEMNFNSNNLNWNKKLFFKYVDKHQKQGDHFNYLFDKNMGEPVILDQTLLSRFSQQVLN